MVIVEDDAKEGKKKKKFTLEKEKLFC